MELTLYLPGLLLPAAVRHDTLFDLAAPALSQLLGRGQRHEEAADWLPHVFGLPGPLPAASLRKVGAGETAAGVHLCLDPVHWLVGREGITLADVRLDEAEATSLIEAVQPLVAEWGTLSASAPDHWELVLSRSLLLDTRPLPDALGQPVAPGLPGGPDGPAWRRLIAEIQTVLHAHPVNRQREQRGVPVVNSLWPWGAGSLPQTHASEFDVVWSRDAVLAGLCALTDTPCIHPPEGYLPASGAVLCHLAGLAAPARSLDALAWRATLQQLDRDWIAPAIKALKKGECLALRLVGGTAHAPQQHVAWSLVRGNLWRFWRRPLPLTELA